MPARWKVLFWKITHLSKIWLLLLMLPHNLVFCYQSGIPNTTSLIHPSIKGVIVTFKVCNLRGNFAQASAATEKDPEKTLMQFGKDYNTQDYIHTLAWACGDVTKEGMNGICIWKETFKRFTHDFKGFVNDEVGNINKTG
jgi:hypothetical protein